MDAEVRAGTPDTYAGTVPSGQVGTWRSDSSDNDFDDFQVRDIAGPSALDTGRAAWRDRLRCHRPASPTGPLSSVQMDGRYYFCSTL